MTDFGDDMGELLLRTLKERAERGFDDFFRNHKNAEKTDEAFKQMLAMAGDEAVQVDFATEDKAREFAETVRSAGGEAGWEAGTMTVVVTPNSFFAACKTNPNILNRYPDVEKRLSSTMMDKSIEKETAAGKDGPAHVPAARAVLANDKQLDYISSLFDKGDITDEDLSGKELSELTVFDANEILNKHAYHLDLKRPDDGRGLEGEDAELVRPKPQERADAGQDAAFPPVQGAKEEPGRRDGRGEDAASHEDELVSEAGTATVEQIESDGTNNELTCSPDSKGKKGGRGGTATAHGADNRRDRSEDPREYLSRNSQECIKASFAVKDDKASRERPAVDIHAPQSK